MPHDSPYTAAWAPTCLCPRPRLSFPKLISYAVPNQAKPSLSKRKLGTPTASAPEHQPTSPNSTAVIPGRAEGSSPGPMSQTERYGSLPVLHRVSSVGYRLLAALGAGTTTVV